MNVCVLKFEFGNFEIKIKVSRKMRLEFQAKINDIGNLSFELFIKFQKLHSKR